MDRLLYATASSRLVVLVYRRPWLSARLGSMVIVFEVTHGSPGSVPHLLESSADHTGPSVVHSFIQSQWRIQNFQNAAVLFTDSLGIFQNVSSCWVTQTKVYSMSRFSWFKISHVFQSGEAPSCNVLKVVEILRAARTPPEEPGYGNF